MRPASLAVLLISLAAPAVAQAPVLPPAPAAQAAGTVTVDGRPMPSFAVLSVSGDEAQVIAPAFLRLSGAVIEGGDRFLEAWTPSGILCLSAGSDGYQWNAMPGRLSAPTTTSPSGEIVARAGDLARILGMQREGLDFTSRPQPRPAVPGLDAAPPAPGLLPVPTDLEFSDAMLSDAPASPGPPQDEGSDVPGDVLPPGPRLVSFRAQAAPASDGPAYTLQVVVANPGDSALATPVEVQYLEAADPEGSFQIMGSDLIRTLPAGQTATFRKNVVLAGPTPRFRAVLLMPAPGGPALVLGTQDASP